jgi:hypothetical protein
MVRGRDPIDNFHNLLSKCNALVVSTNAIQSKIEAEALYRDGGRASNEVNHETVQPATAAYSQTC